MNCTLWAPIPAFTGHEASDLGDIRDKHGRLIKQRPAANGAMQVHIGKATAMVHSLVLRAHTGHPLVSGYRPKHRNGDRGDNRLENLVWAGKSKT